ncbi:MAG: acyloxyacyl hydrolase [Deltaproteobacteria bacterium]|nr:acyloxyacyl hydrolase [Deltaproteobacteria bacterium]
MLRLRLWTAMAICFSYCLPAISQGEGTVPTRYGIGFNYGMVYDPGNEIDFVQGCGFALFDYDAVWPHRAPEPLRFKVETDLGVITEPRTRAILSVNVLALYYLDWFRTATLRPYAEAGIGLIYTDFQAQGQGLRINFNPQAGLGADIDLGRGGLWFAALRAHHVSNAGLDEDNRGINSVVFSIGKYLP